MDLSIFKAKLAATTQELADAGREADVAGGAARSATLDRLRRAASAVDELIRLCNGEAPAQRDCPACSKAVMAAATLCGYCWTRLTPVPR